MSAAEENQFAQAQESSAARNSGGPPTQHGASRSAGSANELEGKPKGLPKKKIPCRFWGSISGCRSGTACPYYHEQETAQNASGSQRGVEKSKMATHGPTSSTGPSEASSSRRRYPNRPADASKVSAKPVPKMSPRDFQIGQIKRRFSPEEKTLQTESTYAIHLVPSDPDFPFELQHLDCILHVPLNYPESSALPSLEVKNTEMERGYQINVERGFSGIVSKSPNATLLNYLNTLDHNLEALLVGEKAETIKIIPNRKTVTSEPPVENSGIIAEPSPQVPVKRSEPPSFTPVQLSGAAERREMHTSQLESRLGSLPLFSKASDGFGYTIPITPRKHKDLPSVLQGVNSVQLIVPRLYPLHPPKIKLLGVGGDEAKKVEKAFEKRSQNTWDESVSLVARVNFLTQNMHILFAEAVPDDDSPETLKDSKPVTTADIPESRDKPAKAAIDDKPHVQVIPRPPEWDLYRSAAFMSSHDDDEDSDDSPLTSSEEEDENEETPELGDAKSKREDTAALDHGIALDLPNLELHGIELLEPLAVNITAKCNRCKEINTINNLRHGAPPQTAVCSKCSTVLSASFRRELLFEAGPGNTTNPSHRAGQLSLEGCVPQDLLPSTFTPTCAACSTAYTATPVTAVRGDTAVAVCRSCHGRMSFLIPETRFLQVSAARSALPLRRAKKPRENLGIKTGDPLPHRGRCTHYSKSYRWFRFGCCMRVYPCDKCHDAKEEHPNEHAPRMICGFCSREQPFKPEECGFCKKGLVGKKGGGFWEGGKGTRDKVKMNRKDPRKYKRRGAGNS